MHGIADNDVFSATTGLGIFFLMLIAGIDMRPQELAGKSNGAISIAMRIDQQLSADILSCRRRIRMLSTRATCKPTWGFWRTMSLN